MKHYKLDWPNMKFDNQMAGPFQVNEQVGPPIDWTLLYGSEASIPELGLIVRPDPVNSLVANPAPGPSNIISSLITRFSIYSSSLLFYYINFRFLLLLLSDLGPLQRAEGNLTVSLLKKTNKKK